MLRHVDAPIPADCDVDGLVELTVPGTAVAPLQDESAGGVEQLNPVVARIGHVETAGTGGGHAVGPVELPVPAPERPPLAEVAERSGRGRRGRSANATPASATSVRRRGALIASSPP